MIRDRSVESVRLDNTPKTESIYGKAKLHEIPNGRASFIGHTRVGIFTLRLPPVLAIILTVHESFLSIPFDVRKGCA